MPRRKRRNTRNKSSESENDELDAKCQRRDNGGSGGGLSISALVSDVIKEVRHTLYSDGKDIGGIEGNIEDKPVCSPSVLDASVNSVFENSGRDNHKMADSGARSGNGESVPSCSLNDVMTLLNTINSKIQKIDTRLEKLEKLENKVDRLDSDLKVQINKLWNHVNDSTKRLDERIRKVEDSVDSSGFLSGEIAEKVSRLETECNQAKEDMCYMQSQSMRNNLVFANIPEESDETPDITERTLRKFLTEKLQMAQDIVDNIKFERVHRMGQKRRGKGRSIVAKFTFYKDREDVRRQSSKLKNTDFLINEQFPKAIADRRKKLYPRMMAERKAGRKAWLSYDTLYVDGRPVEGGRA